MQYSAHILWLVGVEYALHCLVYLIDVPSTESVGIKDLAKFQGLSETFLSKVFGKLSKAGIVRSVPGVKGGYKLAKSPEDISFWDVIEAVEGPKPIFQCKNIKDNGYLYREKGCTPSASCTINLVMLSAEEKMRDFLRSKKLSWLNEELERVLPKQIREETRKYFLKSKKKPLMIIPNLRGYMRGFSLFKKMYIFKLSFQLVYVSLFYLMTQRKPPQKVMFYNINYREGM